VTPERLAEIRHYAGSGLASYSSEQAICELIAHIDALEASVYTLTGDARLASEVLAPVTEAARRATDEAAHLRRQLDSVLEERLAADALTVERAALALSHEQASDPRVRRWLAPQPEPTGEGRRVTEWLLGYIGDDEPLMQDVILHRRVQGIHRYGVELRAHNGRDALCDEAQELTDALLYAAQQRMEGCASKEDIVDRALESLRDVVAVLADRDEVTP
jgi:hypothetical protein